MKQYNFKEIEKKWQKKWEQDKTFKTDEKSGQKKFYCLEMFPYPSGSIHMGHVRNYVIGDVMARFYWLNGYQVLHPIGWDAFGLPAENAAIQHNAEPEQWTRRNISDMKDNLKEIGIAYDWDREFATCDPDYYKWNQWIFLKLFEKGLAYRKEATVNWCPSCQTVLANEQVHAGQKCWRCDAEVVEKKLKQWFLKITEYAGQLLDDHKELEGAWPPEVLLMQKNWIGKSHGADVDFDLPDGRSLNVFTTRPDTLFGATFMVLAPEHPLVAELVKGKKIEKEVQAFIREQRKLKSSERVAEQAEKKGIFLECTCTNPVNGEEIPIWIANYVLMEYGTGAIMAVPAHDRRDYEFAQKYGITIREVIRGANPDILEKEAYVGSGRMVNSGDFNNLPSEKGAQEITAWLEKKGKGTFNIQYRLRDWLISRQRYWGTPIPVVYCDACGIVPVPYEDLPVILPGNVTFTGKGKSPLGKIEEFIETSCPKCGKEALREVDTMDTFVDSSWYFLRFCDPANNTSPFDQEKADYWMPVDLYIGGIEHACMHLIYARFFHKFLRDIGLVKCSEPFKRLISQGMVTLGGEAMSKSRGNIVESSAVAEKCGADAGRIFILFAAPPEKNMEWSDTGIEGSQRFLQRVWRVVQRKEEKPVNSAVPAQEKALLRRIHRTIQRVTRDISERYQLNTAVAAIMELVNELTAYPDTTSPVFNQGIKTVVMLLSPFAPHVCEELWTGVLKQKPMREIGWPNVDEKLLEEESAEVVIQVNGKLRSKITVPIDEGDELVKKKAAQDPKVRPWVDGKRTIKTIYVPKKLVNFVVK